MADDSPSLTPYVYRREKMKRTLLESTLYEGLKNGTHIDVEVFYDEGGVSYFSGGTQRAGTM
jgi:hypothetical protein